MGMQQDKRIERFISGPSDYSLSELESLLKSLGHHLKRGGTTAGSATTYVNKDGEQPVHFHKPHQHKHFGRRAMKSIYEQVKGYKLIEGYIN